MDASIHERMLVTSSHERLHLLPKSVIRKKYFSNVRHTVCTTMIRKEVDIIMGTIIWKNVIMLITVMIIGIILILLGIRKKKSVYFTAFFFPGLLLLMCSVLFIFAEPYQIRKTMRTDCHILKLDTQYIVNIDGKDIEDIPVKEDTSREDYALEITENYNLAGMLLKTEY